MLHFTTFKIPHSFVPAFQEQRSVTCPHNSKVRTCFALSKTTRKLPCNSIFSLHCKQRHLISEQPHRSTWGDSNHASLFFYLNSCLLIKVHTECHISISAKLFFLKTCNWFKSKYSPGDPKNRQKKLGLFKNHSYPYTFKILAMIHICLLARIFLQKNNHCEYSQAKKKQYVHQKMKRQKPIYLSRSGTGEKHILAISDKLLGLFIY